MTEREHREVILGVRGAPRRETEMGAVVLEEGEMIPIPKGITHRSTPCDPSAEENLLLELEVRDELVYVGDDNRATRERAARPTDWSSASIG